jgi:hypothetical protein
MSSPRCWLGGDDGERTTVLRREAGRDDQPCGIVDWHPHLGDVELIGRRAQAQDHAEQAQRGIIRVAR